MRKKTIFVKKYKSHLESIGAIDGSYTFVRGEKCNNYIEFQTTVKTNSTNCSKKIFVEKNTHTTDGQTQ